jgi:hypothetical protein
LVRGGQVARGVCLAVALSVVGYSLMGFCTVMEALAKIRTKRAWRRVGGTS